MECVGSTAHSNITDEHTCDTGSEAASNVGADQAEQAHEAIPKAQLTQQLYKAEDKTPEESCEMLQGPTTEDLLQAAVTKNFSNQLAVSELESNLQETSGETPRNITVETNHSPRGGWPSWSLPPPEENLRKKNAEKNSTLGENSNQQSDEITTVSRQTSPEAPSSSHNSLVTGRNSSRQSNDVAGTHPPVNHEPDLHNSDQGSRNPAEHYHDDTEYEVLNAELQYKLRRHVEESQVLKAENQRLKKLIRQQDKRYDDAKVQLGTLKKENKELSEELNTSLRQREELQLQTQKLEEKIEQQRLDFEKKMAVMSEECRNAEMDKMQMIKESREMAAQLENSQAQINCLQEDLEVTERLHLQYRRYFEEKTELLAESNEMCKKSLQMCLWKDEECKRMNELIGEMEVRQEENQEEIEQLRQSLSFAGKLYLSQKQQCKDKDAVLHIANGLMKKLQQESKQQLQDEREQQKIELDRRVGEASQAFHNANSDKMKSMKLKLSMETKRVKRIKWMLARERSNRRKLELKLANKKRKGKRKGKRNKKSNIRKCPRDEEEEGAGGGGDDGDDYDDDVVFDDDDDDSSQSGGMFGGHESHDVGELNSTGPRKEGEGESEGGGGDENGVDDVDDEDNSDDDDNSSQSGGTNQGHESPNDGDFSSTGPRKEGGGEGGGGNGVNDNHDNHDDSSQSVGTNGGHESQDDGDFSSTGQMTLGCMRRRK